MLGVRSKYSFGIFEKTVFSSFGGYDELHNAARGIQTTINGFDKATGVYSEVNAGTYSCGINVDISATEDADGGLFMSTGNNYVHGAKFYSINNSASGHSYGIYVSSQGGAQSCAIYATTDDTVGHPNSWAGWFNGNVCINGYLKTIDSMEVPLIHGGGAFSGGVSIYGDLDVSGTLSKGAGSFLIDHPLDPLHKTLRHNFVESPWNMCVYPGKVQLDERGEAVVEMPDYFKALVRENEALAQITPIGKPFNVGYEWDETFTKLTIYGAPNRKVSYFVYADRDDPVMKKLYKPVEEIKGKGNDFTPGKLLYPEAYGYPKEMGQSYGNVKNH